MSKFRILLCQVTDRYSHIHILGECIVCLLRSNKKIRTTFVGREVSFILSTTLPMEEETWQDKNTVCKLTSPEGPRTGEDKTRVAAGSITVAFGLVGSSSSHLGAAKASSHQNFQNELLGAFPSHSQAASLPSFLPLKGKEKDSVFYPSTSLPQHSKLPFFLCRPTQITQPGIHGRLAGGFRG